MISIPQILIINPNTAVDITARLRSLAVEEARERAEVVAVTARFGARYISSRTSAAIAGHGALDAYAAAISAGSAPDAVVLACFGDPGLAALRELSPAPVFGFAESGLAAAAALPGRFAIATVGDAWRDMLGETAVAMGIENRLAGFIVLDDETREPSRAKGVIAREYARLGATRVILGGTGLIPVIPEIMATLDVPVIDPHRTAIREAVAGIARPAATSHLELVDKGTFGGISPELGRLLERTEIKQPMIEGLNG